MIKAPKRGRQVVVARGGNDRIVTHGHDDVVCGGSGADTINTGGNKDTIRAGSGNDVVDSGPGSDRVDLGAGADVMFGGGGGEAAHGGPGADRLYGEQQDDRLFGEGGDDLLIGSQGSDRFHGGAGSDWLRGDTEGDTYRGDAGEDWMSFATATPPGFGKTGVLMHRGSGSIPPKTNGDGEGEIHNSVENVVGSAFDDLLLAPISGRGIANGIADRGDECSDFAVTACAQDPRTGDEAIAMIEPSPRDPGLIILGGPSDDRWRIAPTSGGLTITGTTLAAGPGCTSQGPGEVVCPTPNPLGYAVAYGDAGADQLQIDGAFAQQTVVKLDGGPGGDLLRGGRGAELIYSGGAKFRPPETWSDVLEGGGGNDVIAIREELETIPPGGGDVLRGGGGADQLVVESPCGIAAMSGGSGGPDIAGFAAVDDGPIKAVVGGLVTRVNRGGLPCQSARLASDFEVLEGTSFDDVLLGSQGRDALILGNNGADRIFGRGGADRLRGEGDADVMVGGGGPDILEARDGLHDLRIDCGPGGLRATVDRRDPRAAGCR